jgi:hypothetical protein
MRTALSLTFMSLASLVTACATDGAPDGTDDLSVSANDVRINTSKDVVEVGYVNGALCKMVFPGGLTSSTETYQIWPVGTNGIVQGATYNTSGRPNLYAVFGTNTAASLTHHVDGFSQFDHYHILENAHGTDVDNTKWDLLAVFPGPNYNAATYQPATSAKEMLAQSAAGILSPVMTLPEAGFPPVVLYMPVTCR